MGYDTRYRLKWTGEEATREDCRHCGGTGSVLICDPVRKAVEDELRCNGSTLSMSSNLEDPVWWYEHDEDMTKLSCDFPDVLFTLRGEGDEASDIWVKYYKGGKVQEERLDATLP